MDQAKEKAEPNSPMPRIAVTTKFSKKTKHFLNKIGSALACLKRQSVGATKHAGEKDL